MVLFPRGVSDFCSRAREYNPFTTPEELKNAALFLRLDQPCTLICHENAALLLRLGQLCTLVCQGNRAFRNTLFKPDELENGRETFCHENEKVGVTVIM